MSSPTPPPGGASFPSSPSSPYGSPGQQPVGNSFDPKAINQLDWVILGAGPLSFVFSFVSYYTFSNRFAEVSESAWAGFFGWFATLSALAGSAFVGLEVTKRRGGRPISNRVIGLGLYATATLCVVLAFFVVPSYLGVDVPDGIDTGHGLGYWASLVLIIAGLVTSLARLQASGEPQPRYVAVLPDLRKLGRPNDSGELSQGGR